MGDLLHAEITEKQARSIKHQMTIAKLPLAKEIDEFEFDETPVNKTLVRNLAGGAFLQDQRNLVLIGGTGTGRRHGKDPSRCRHCPHLRLRQCERTVPQCLRAERQGRMADLLSRVGF